jgi:hypothetical protein
MNKRYKGYWRDLVLAVNRSRTMVVAMFWVIVTTASEHITSLSGVVDNKYYPYIMMGTIALARMKGLSKDIKQKEALK